MTLIAAIAFPDEVFIIGDSRASYPGTTVPPRDELKKVYGLAPFLCLAYTSQDVKFTLKLVESLINSTYALINSLDCCNVMLALRQ